MYGRGTALQDEPWDQDNDPFRNSPDRNALLLAGEYALNRGVILEPHYIRGRRSWSTFNFPLANGLTPQNIEDQLTTIFNEVGRSFKFNASLGFLLRHRTTGEIRYFNPSMSETVFTDPMTIRNRDDLRRAIDRMQALDLTANVDRPNSSWQVSFTTQLKFYVYKMNRFLGASFVDLPTYIINNRHIYTVCDTNRTFLMAHNLCFLVAYAQFEKLLEGSDRTKLCSVKHRVKELFIVWTQYALKKKILKKSQCNFFDFPGVEMSHVPYFEDCFKVSINIYSLDPEGGAQTMFLTYKDKLYTKKMILNSYNHHVNLVLDADGFCKDYVCHICSRSFPYASRLKVHESNCSNKSHLVYPGGIKQHKRHLFDRLSDLRIAFTEENRTFSKYFCCWDLESCLSPDSHTSASGNLSYVNRHTAVACGVCSNVPGFTDAKIITDENPAILTQKMLDYMGLIQEKSRELLLAKYKSLFDQLDNLIESRLLELESQEVARLAQQDLDELLDPHQFNSSDELTVSDDDNEDINIFDSEIDSEKDDDNDKVSAKRKQPDLYLRLLQKLRWELHVYASELPTLSWNGSSYDISLIKVHLLNALYDQEEHRKKMVKELQGSWNDYDYHNLGTKLSVLKKSRKYLSLSNGRLKFIDLMHFLGHIKYSEFLEMFGSENKKYVFPFQAVSQYSDLLTKALPLYDSGDWQNVLTGEHMLEDSDLISKGEHALARQKGLIKYYEIECMWAEKNWSCLMDMLSYYLSLDVKPMVFSAERFSEIWTAENVDVFKDCVSLPSLSERIVWQQSIHDGIVFPLWGYQHRFLYHLIRQSICGGASLILNRFQEIGVTSIKENSSEKTGTIEGRDVNSLYPYIMSQKVPCQSYVWRSKINSFKPETRRRFVEMYVWLSYMEDLLGMTIISGQNLGELRISGYMCDGYGIYFDPLTNTSIHMVFEFFGCLYHDLCGKGDLCPVLSSTRYRVPTLNEARDRAFKKRAELESAGYLVIWEHECDFWDKLKTCEELRLRMNRFKPTFYKKHPGEVTEECILREVKAGGFFGFLLVDVQVMHEYEEQYKEFPVLFSQSDIKYEHLSADMKSYLREKGINYRTRRLLVSANTAEGILLNSDYLQFLIHTNHFHIRIHEVIEFCAENAFTNFVEYITSQKRLAMSQPQTEPYAKCLKLAVCAAYGRCLTNLHKHSNVKYVRGEQSASQAINNPLFRSLEDLEGCFEVTTAKRKLVLREVSYLGCWITLSAKAYMLRLVYNHLFFWIDRSHISLVVHDTDSVYYSLTGDSFEATVKPALRAQFKSWLYERCSDERNNDSAEMSPYLRLCCDRHFRYDSATGGKWKVEYTATSVIALSSKTYYMENVDDDTVKIASKGLSRKRLLNTPNLRNTYEQVLKKRSTFTGINTGFVSVRNKMYTYVQERRAAEYLYVKRHLCRNGIYSTPIPNLTLRPHYKDALVIQLGYDCLSADHVDSFRIEGQMYQTIRQAFVALLAQRRGFLEYENSALLTISSTALIELYKKICTEIRGHDEHTRFELLHSVVSAKFQSNPDCRRVLRLNTDTPIINAELDSYLGVGECVSVVRWLRLDDCYRGGRNSLGRAWVRAFHDNQ